MKFDIRKKDTVRFRRDLNQENKDKILGFVRQHDENAANRVALFLKRIKENVPPIFTVADVKKTQKTKTEFLQLVDGVGRSYCIQSRYFKVIMRDSNHPLTNVFSDFASGAKKK